MEFPDNSQVWNSTQLQVSSNINSTNFSLHQQQLYMTRFVIQKILAPVVVVFGLFGNILNIIVLTRPWMRSSTNMYLTCLAVYDILYLVLAFTLSVWHFDSTLNDTQWYLIYKWHFGKPLADTCSNTAVWLTLTFTLERYIAVCNPMKGKIWCTATRAKYITILVCVIAASLTFPEFFENRVESINAGNGVVYTKLYTDFASCSTYQVGYVNMNQVIFTFLPLVLLMIFNSLLVRVVMQASHTREHLGHASMIWNERQLRHSREQQRITIMLISVVLVFLLSQTPQAIQHLYVVYLGTLSPENQDPDRNSLLKITGNVFNLMVMVNASINFILYSAFSTKFRRTFNRLFCRCLQVMEKSNVDLISEMATQGFNPEYNMRNMFGYGVSYRWPKSNSWNNKRKCANV